MIMAQKKMERLVVEKGFFALCLAMLLASGCYIPGLGALGDADDPPANTDPSGVDETYYGKFLLYEVGLGKVERLTVPTDGTSQIPYIVGETYLPSNVPALSNIYNIMHVGDGRYFSPFDLQFGTPFDNNQTFFYRNDNITPITFRASSSMPEGIVLNNSLSLFYNNFMLGNTVEFENSCADVVPNTTPGTPLLFVNTMYRGVFSNPAPDVDVYDFTIGPTEIGTILVFRGRVTLFNRGSDDQFRHRMKLVLTDDAGNVLAASAHGNDLWRYVDPEISYNFQVPDLYHLRVEDLLDTACDNSNKDGYWLYVESPSFDVDVNHIMKGEIQPARNGNPSGNPQLNGGPTFEPDDLSTKIKDDWPDCDGVPGTGDEGDAGVFDRCGSVTDYGARDGKMEYQEVDDKSSIDDGEYFQGRATNVGTALDSEPSIINAPDRDSLLMFVNYGSRIYMLESVDGTDGLRWDLSNIINDRPSIVPRQYRGDRGDIDSPVVSSGPLGFCDTIPDPGDAWGATALEHFVYLYGESVTATGAVPIAPTGYPGTYAVNFGSNNHLDSPALVDVQAGDTIYSGTDGIINTFLAPRYVAYGEVPVAIYYPPPYNRKVLITILPGSTETLPFHGPGNPDDPAIYEFNGATVGYQHPLANPTYGGSNQSGFLLGDDEWNPDIFKGNTLSPPAYLQKQQCSFYMMGISFDQCAYGVPQDENGEEPPVIESGADGELNTLSSLLIKYRGDDHLCHDGDTVAICAGRDGSFGWQDIYIPILGDDRLEVVQDTGSTIGDYFPGPAAASLYWTEILNDNTAGLSWGPRQVIGISSGPDHVLQTGIIDSTTTIDIDRWIVYVGGDHMCETLDGYPAICPGVEAKIDLYQWNDPNYKTRPEPTRKILSVWPMYFSSPSFSGLKTNNTTDAMKKDLRFARSDYYGDADDVFCMIGSEMAICPGMNGYFQSYPTSQKVKVAEDTDPFNLYRRIAGYLTQDCYTMVTEHEQKSWEDDAKTYYRLYHFQGVRHDDRIKWDAAKGYFISTGQNGINQSCMASGDMLTVHHVNGRAVTIGLYKGMPDMPIISVGPNGVLDTYPLADERIYWGDGIYKVSTGRDGVSNSFAMGDDRLEFFMGTGKPDYPCVRSGDGIADTYAQRNDTQLYDPLDNEKTGFDSFNVWGPDAVAVGDKIYLYYTALGWHELGPSNRDGKGALGDLGECRRAGFDQKWGKWKRDLSQTKDISKHLESIYAYDFDLRDGQFTHLLDDSPGVILAPRIGVATSTVSRLRADPGDWDFRNQPALDLGRQCAGSLDLIIDLGVQLPVLPDTNFNGAYSPEIKFTRTPDGESLLFLMFFTGRAAIETDNAYEKAKSQVGVARSLDGISWEVVRDLNPLVWLAEIDIIATVIGTPTEYAYPTVVNAGADEYGEPMYGMFFNQSVFADIGWNDITFYDFKRTDHIGYAVRKGKSSISSFCSLRSNYWTDDSGRVRSILQVVILAIPLLLVFSVRLYRRPRN
ncbi:MAG TPA: hypothetical protein VM658_08340 [bacterium]|nr:hypothetical protein [bacterium]